MSQYYNEDYTMADVSAILNRIQDCVRSDRFIISQNDRRLENQALINEYNLSFSLIKNILLGIKPEDFCHSLRNRNPGYENETLYVFCPQVVLFDSGDEATEVDLYTKFNILNRSSGDHVVVISFHHLQRPIRYLFR